MVGRLPIVVATVIASMAAAALWLILDARRTPDGSPIYVALGSSYAAGAGLGPRQPGSPIVCQRSDNGYPPRLARQLKLPFVDMTCSGSVTKHVLVGGQYFQDAQIRTLTTQTRLVTLTVGGNDVGFVRDLYLLAARNSDTWFGWTVRTLWHGPSHMTNRDFPKLAFALQSLLRDIHRRSPQARIVVATYPAVLPPSGTCPQLGLSATDADSMRKVQAALAAVTGRIAEQEGATVVDMTAIGADHSACSSTPWTRGRGSLSEGPFHPTIAGAKATAEAIAAAISRSKWRPGLP
jgi:lysophospholipase L1-like esterase